MLVTPLSRECPDGRRRKGIDQKIQRGDEEQFPDRRRVREIPHHEGREEQT